MRVRAAVVVLLCACGAPPRQRLPPAGDSYDEGTGQLAAASISLRVDGVGDDDGAVREDRFERRYETYDLGLGYGGLGYGGLGYGGFGGAGYGGWGGIGYGPPPPQGPPYQPSIVVQGAAIEGTVRWKAGGGVPWPAGCGAARVARAGVPVGGAVVYLDGVRSGRAVPYASGLIKTGGVLQVTDCAILPAAQVAGPLPSPLIVENADRSPARLHHERPGGVTTIELDAGGRGHLALERAGASQIRDGVRAPAWVIAQAHPYYVVTGDDGRFAIEEIPAGVWELVVWYPPLVTAIGTDGPVWSPPTIERRKITVGKAAVVTADFALTPAR